jgi:hypothetical protein
MWLAGLDLHIDERPVDEQACVVSALRYDRIHRPGARDPQHREPGKNSILEVIPPRRDRSATLLVLPRIGRQA